MSAFFHGMNGEVAQGVPAAAELPSHLQKKARTLSPKKSPKEVLMKEQAVAENRAQIINARVEQAAAHQTKVKEAQATKQAFADTGMEIIDNGTPVELPSHLQQRLNSMPAAKTTEENAAKEQRAHAARETLIGAKVETAKAHQAKVEEVRERKAEFQETGMEIMDNGKAVELPKHLQQRLNSMPAAKTAEENAAKEQRAHAARETLIGAKVDTAKAHDAVVQQRMGDKKRKAEAEADAPTPMES